MSQHLFARICFAKQRENKHLRRWQLPNQIWIAQNPPTDLIGRLAIALFSLCFALIGWQFIFDW